MILALMLKYIGIGLLALTGVLLAMLLFVWATWFRFPRISGVVAKFAFELSGFGRSVALGCADVVSAPFRGAARRMDRLQMWAKRQYQLVLARKAQLALE